MPGMSDSTRAGLMLSHGIAMLALGFGLLYIRAAMTNRFFDLLGCVFALLLMAASLLFIALSDLFCIIEARHLSGLRGLLAMSLVAAGAGAVLVFYPCVTLRGVCACASAYALLLGLGKLHLAHHWPGAGKPILYGLAGIAFCASAFLALTADRATDDRGTLLALALYSLFVGLQTLAARHYALTRRSVAA